MVSLHVKLLAMKSTFTIVIACIVHSALFAQGLFTDTLHLNGVSAIYSANGTLFADTASYTTHYNIPGLDEGTELGNTFFAAGFWMGGIDQFGDLHLAAQSYGQFGNDYWSGPIATDYTDPDYLAKYSRVWKMDKSSIDTHIANWNVPGYSIPGIIADWPGNGNTANGEALLLAPFYDRDSNLIYDPLAGDYPIIRGDEAIFIIANDAAFAHTESGGEALGFELHIMAYAFIDPDDPSMHLSQFMNVKLINRSSFTYNDFYFGMFTDPDIGYYGDDYVGCDSTLEMFYAYNGDDYDELGPYAYLTHPPAQGITFLNHPLHMFKYYQNDFSVIGNPFTPEDHYNYLQGKWLDGSEQTLYGNGYGGDELSKFMFPAHPLDALGWSMVTEGTPPMDMRGIGSIRPVTFNAGDTTCIDIVLTTAFGADTLTYDGTFSDMTAWNAVEGLKAYVSDIRSWYDANVDACAIRYTAGEEELGVEQEMLTGARVFPNPADTRLSVMVTNGKQLQHVWLSNTAGQMVFLQNTVGGEALSLDIQSLASGLYQLSVQYTDGETRSTPIVIQ